MYNMNFVMPQHEPCVPNKGKFGDSLNIDHRCAGSSSGWSAWPGTDRDDALGNWPIAAAGARGERVDRAL